MSYHPKSMCKRFHQLCRIRACKETIGGHERIQTSIDTSDTMATSVKMSKLGLSLPYMYITRRAALVWPEWLCSMGQFETSMGRAHTHKYMCC